MPPKKKSEEPTPMSQGREKVMVVTEVVEIIEPQATETNEEVEPSETPVSNPVQTKTEDAPVDAVPTKKSEPVSVADEAVDENQVQEEEDKKLDQEERKVVVKELFTAKDSALDSEITMNSQSSWMSIVIWILITLIVAVLIGSGLIFFVRGGVPSFGTPTKPTPTALPTTPPEPTATPTPPDKGKIEVQILNGGGTAGAATKMKNLLDQKGYVVVATGNTDEFSYTQTEIVVKAGQEAIRALIAADIQDSYSLATSKEVLPDDAPYSVRVIVGK